MILRGVLSPDVVRELRKVATVPSTNNQTLKHNEESEGAVDIDLSWLPLFPAKWFPPRINRYREGDYYKAHTDSPFMYTDKERFRVDLSLTVWLNDDYEGGELVVDGVPYKGNAGDAILYRGDTYHEVLPVTKGERVCLLTWIQSEVRCPEDRDILYKLCLAMQRHEDPDLNNAVQRLTKRWIE